MLNNNELEMFVRVVVVVCNWATFMNKNCFCNQLNTIIRLYISRDCEMFMIYTICMYTIDYQKFLLNDTLEEGSGKKFESFQ